MWEEGIRKILEESKYTVALTGMGMLFESGFPSIRDGRDAYRIEQKYGYSADELFHSACFNTRPELFYKFYKDEILKRLEIEPGKGYTYLKEMQDRGWLQAVVTRRIYGLSRRAGCHNVIEIHNSILENYCPRCGKEYDLDYVKNSPRLIPTCEKCQAAIRPRAIMFGEMVNNAVMTRATEEVGKAEVLLLLGTDMSTSLVKQLIGYFEGKYVILITLHEHYKDRYADIVVHSRVDDALEKILKK